MYGLFFTPNWNLWARNYVWEKVAHKESDIEKYIAALYVDVDVRDQELTSTELLKVILDIIQKDNIPIQYIVRSWWGFHLYMFIKESERRKLWEELHRKRADIQIWLADIFPWWDKRVHKYWKLMRCPFSNHRRTWQPIKVELLKLIRGDGGITLKKVEDVNDISIDENLCIWEEHIEHFLKNISKVEVKKEQGKSILPDMSSKPINNLDIREVITKLKEYPREYKNKLYTFELSWNRIWFTMDWVKYFPDGYRINITDNYVHNFSFWEHDLLERPRWQVFPFLYHYFNKDFNKIDEFLTKEYGISLSPKGEDGLYLSLTNDKWYIHFTNEWVIYHKSVYNKKDKEFIEVQSKLFETPIYVEGTISTNYDLLWESEDLINYYVIRKIADNDQVIINFTEDRKKFNRIYGKKWLMFLWSEYDLLDFYMTINKAVESWALKQFDFRYLNWYYKDCYIMWDKLIWKDYEELHIEDMDMILKTQEIRIQDAKEEVWLDYFWEKLCKVFPNRSAMLSMCTFVMLLLWDKFRSPILGKYKQQVLIPWLFVSGTTRAGKTTLLTILKNWARMEADTRKFSIKSTTPQPVRQAATDDFILHIEEFTWDIGEIKETILRDILNKAKTARGNADGSNVNYIYRAWMILDWERLPKSESVANRCVVIPMFEEDKIWNEKLLWEFKNYSFLSDFIQKLYNISTMEILKAFRLVEAELASNWIRDRNLLLYSFLLLTNRLFQIFPEEQLIEAIKENLNLLNTVDKEHHELSNLLSELIIKQRIAPTQIELENNKRQILVPFTHEIKMQNKIIIINVLNKYKWLVTLRWNNIVCNIDSDDKSPLMKDVYDTVITFSKYFKRANTLDLI